MSDPKKPRAGGAPSVEFHGEQDGGPERQLKGKLVTLFQSEPAVQQAFLAKIQAGGERSVALCILAESGDEEALVDKVSRVFAVTFQRSQHLDILFLDDKQLPDITKVCRAFYPVRITHN